MIDIFTGLIEEKGKLSTMVSNSKSMKLTIQADKVLQQVKLGDSIAVNGVCLTVVNYSANEFSVEAMPETVSKTTLGKLKVGSEVNLERALRLEDRLGGHIVQGHVDGIGRITDKRKSEIAIVFTFAAPPEIMRYTVTKGSIAIDGISLTVVEANDESFSVSLIPHTAHYTTLGNKEIGELVNIESDIIGRYIEKLLHPPGAKNEKRLNLGFLAENGFI